MPALFIYNPAVSGRQDEDIRFFSCAGLEEPLLRNNNYRIQEMERVIVVHGLFVQRFEFECV